MKTQEFLAEADATVAEEVNAKKQTLQASDALAIAATVQHIYAAKGKQIVHLDLKKERPDQATLEKVLLGPTGNLRAPTLRVGKNLIVGFDRATYERLLT